MKEKYVILEEEKAELNDKYEVLEEEYDLMKKREQVIKGTQHFLNSMTEGE